MKPIIEEVIQKTELELTSKIKLLNKELDDYISPINLSHTDTLKEREEKIKERVSGRLSTEEFTLNMQLKSEYENQLRELSNFKFMLAGRKR